MSEPFGKYELLEKIATGGMADVFLANQVGEFGGFSKQVAIKRMFPHLMDQESTITMFIDEARIVSSLTHPNIVQIYDLGVVDGAFFIAMEYVDGKDLREVCEVGIAQNNFMSRELAVRIISDVAAGLHYAHARVDAYGRPMNIVHRDVSPQNVLISTDGHVKLCDFGIARAESRLTHTRTGEFKGKFSYMSPEQFKEGPIDARSDIFALGIVLYEITVCTRLFRSANEYEAMKKVAAAHVTPPSQLRAGYPAELERIVLKALQRDPGRRYQTAEALHLDLEEWLYSRKARVGKDHLAQYMSALFGPPVATPPPPVAEPPGELGAESTDVESLGDTTAPLSVPADMVAEAKAHYYPKASAAQTARPAAKPAVRPAVTAAQVEEHQERDDATYELVAMVRDEIPPRESGETVEPGLELGAPAPVLSSVSSTGAQRTHVHPGPTQPMSKIEVAAPAPGQHAPSDASWSGIIRVKELTRTNRRNGAIAVAGFVCLLLVGAFFLTRDDSARMHDPNASPNLERLAASEPFEDPTQGILVNAPGAQVLLTSHPPGASVIINGLPGHGQTPGSFELVDGHDNEVILFLEGHQPHRRLIHGDADAEVEAATLEPLKDVVRERVQFNSQPPGATVYLNGVEVGVTPLPVEVAMQIEHHVYMTRSGRYPFAALVAFVPGADNRVEGTLADAESISRQHYVELIHNAQPRGTRVLVDGEPGGVSPYVANHRRDHLVDLYFEAMDRQPMTRRIATRHVGAFLLRPLLEPVVHEKGRVSMTVFPAANIYIGSRAFGESPLRDIELNAGKHPVVFETSHGRIRGELTVHPDKHTAYRVRLQDNQARIEPY